MKNVVTILTENNINGFGNFGGTDKATDHSYDLIYDEIFSPYREKEITLLEIGVQYGGSALLWHEFFPNSKLVLIDIKDQVHPSIWEKMDVNKYDYLIRDAFEASTLDELKLKYPDGFDIIVEDGPHTIESQIYTISKYTNLLKKGGLLVIEDIQRREDCDLIINSITDVPHESVELRDVRHVKGRYDDLMIIVKK
jgi:cephalosporin hydroxylase